ncbi:MAG: four helix bundle protein [Flavobacteriales bacterium]|nr:four helix bundle protein [Flavobacteriales bacterium]MCP5521322.1 four helix bundle protein [Verrucomicrobiales bacterium]
MAYQSFEDLEVWKRACRQAVDIYRTHETCKRYSLRDQMERASLSVPSNIAEGQERDSDGDFVRFLRIAKGSNGELRTQIYVAIELGLLERDKGRAMVAESKEISSMLQGLIRAVHTRRGA